MSEGRRRVYVRGTLAERFWARVERPDDLQEERPPLERPHWTWTGSLDREGYGVLSDGARVGNTSRVVYAHRVSWRIAGGADVRIYLACGDRTCVNPSHWTSENPRKYKIAAAGETTEGENGAPILGGKA